MPSLPRVLLISPSCPPFLLLPSFPSPAYLHSIPPLPSPSTPLQGGPYRSIWDGSTEPCGYPEAPQLTLCPQFFTDPTHPRGQTRVTHSLLWTMTLISPHTPMRDLHLHPELELLYLRLFSPHTGPQVHGTPQPHQIQGSHCSHTPGEGRRCEGTAGPT